jgi:hypothetical protein
MKQVAPLRYDVIFKKAFGQPEMFAALVGDLLDIQLEIDEVENDKVFIPSVGKVAETAQHQTQNVNDHPMLSRFKRIYL